MTKHVIIVGAGFAGLNAAKKLGHMKDLRVTLIDKRNHHLFQPLLYQVALAVLSPGDIAQPIRTILRQYQNIEVLMDEAIGFDLPQQRVKFKTGAELEYDYLIIATGSTHSYFGHDDWSKLAPGLKTVEDATEIRRRVLLAFELAERQKSSAFQERRTCSACWTFCLSSHTTPFASRHCLGAKPKQTPRRWCFLQSQAQPNQNETRQRRVAKSTF